MTIYEQIEIAIKNSPSVELLKTKNRELIILFLVKIFTSETIVSSEHIHYKLIEYLEAMGTGFDEETDEKNEKIFKTYEEKAKEKIQLWTNKGFLTNYQTETGEVFYELSSHSSKTIDWLASLKKEEYIGTESKFKMLFNQLKILVEFTNDNKEKRLQLLEDRKSEIEQQIQRLEMGEDIEIFEENQIIPDFKYLTKLAKELLSDFKEVDDNFKVIIKEIYQKQTDISLKKGHILQYTFDAFHELKNSSQGKSFYAFWEFLNSRNLQEEWSDLVQELYQRLVEKSIEIDDSFLKNMKQHLYNAAKKVSKTNDKMAEKLSRIIRDRDVSETEITKSIIQEIKKLLIEISKKEIESTFSFEIETGIEIKMPFERKLTFEQSDEVEYKQKPQVAKTQLSDFVYLNKAFNFFAIDRNELRKRVKTVLREKKQATILDIVDYQGGISKGLPELLGYIGIVKDFKYTINENKTQDILFDKNNRKLLQIPEIILTQ